MATAQVATLRACSRDICVGLSDNSFFQVQIKEIIFKQFYIMKYREHSYAILCYSIILCPLAFLCCRPFDNPSYGKLVPLKYLRKPTPVA